MKRTLSIIALAVTMAAATNVLAAPGAVLHQHFIDSQTFTFDGGTTIYRTFGAIELDTSNQIWVWSKVTTGARFARTDWVRIDAAVPAYNASCTAVTPTWVSVMPYPDNTALHFCHVVGTMIYGDQSRCSGSQNGTYRALGDGGLLASQGGGVRNGAVFLDSSYRTYVLVIKTADSNSNPILGCGTNNNGPGSVGSWILMEISNNVP